MTALAPDTEEEERLVEPTIDPSAVVLAQRISAALVKISLLLGVWILSIPG